LGSGSLPPGVINNTLRYDGATWVTNTALVSDGASATAPGNFFVNNNLTVGGTITVGGQTISSAFLNNWNTAYSWGSHAIACPAGQAVPQLWLEALLFAV